MIRTLATTLQSAVMRRNSLFMATIFATAFVVEIAYDQTVEFFWRWHNRGVHLFHLFP